MIKHPMHSALTFCTLSLILFACNDSSGGEKLPVNVINLFDGGAGGACIQPSFPSEQPDLFISAPPRFLLTTSQAQQSTTGQAQVRPGNPIEVEIPVNTATRQVIIELTDAWEPTRVIATDEVQTSGNERITRTIVPDSPNRGRYYMKLTLCGVDCDEREVVFDVVACPPKPVPEEPCGINLPYERTLYEGGDLVQSDQTCIDLGGVPDFGSGTILIQ